jgi:AraC-like DNA-binding protein
MQILYEKVPKPQNTSFYCYTNTGPQFVYSMHHHPECEIVIILQGSGRCYLSSRVVDYQPGDGFMFGPDMPHTFESSPSEAAASRAYVVQFCRDFAGGQLWQVPELEKAGKLISDSSRGLYFPALLSAGENALSGWIESRNGAGRFTALLELIEKLSNAVSKSIFPFEPALASSKNPGRLIKVLNYVHNSSSEEIRVETAAELAGMSVSGFCKFFKRRLGQPFNGYLIDTRIERACQMLIKTSEPVISVSLACGFNNLSNFNRQFIKRRGIPPSRYRKADKKTSPA